LPLIERCEVKVYVDQTLFHRYLSREMEFPLDEWPWFNETTFTSTKQGLIQRLFNVRYQLGINGPEQPYLRGSMKLLIGFNRIGYQIVFTFYQVYGYLYCKAPGIVPLKYFTENCSFVFGNYFKRTWEWTDFQQIKILLQ
jgi:hypothetical protein